jgi:hypothetical protein
MSDMLSFSALCPAGSSELQPLIECSGRLLCEVTPGSQTQAAITAFIQRRFMQSYGAQPRLRIPGLMALTGSHGALLAAVGVRPANDSRLFLEDYLDSPIETLIPGDAPVDRRDLVEIAHLAGVEAGVSRYLFAALTLWLHDNGYRWIVFTGTELLRNSFRRMGIRSHALAPADPRRLPDGGAGWGRYYDHDPIVMAADVEAGYQALKRGGILQRTRSVATVLADGKEGAYGFIA